MHEKLAELQKEQKAVQAHAAWREHIRIIKGNPVRIYEGEKFALKKSRNDLLVLKRMR